jgi:hypothetical protein
VSDPPRASLVSIRRAAAAVELRLRLDRALKALPLALVTALAFAAAIVGVRKLLPSWLTEVVARQLLIAAAVAVVLVVAIALARRLAPRAGATRLDRHHALDGRITNALAFAALPEGERTALMELAIDDARQHARALSPSRAAPLRIPVDLAIPLALGLGTLALSMLEIRTLRVVPTITTIEALELSPDDLELLRETAKALEKQSQSPEMKAAIERFNQLIEDLANKRLDRAEAFRKMEALERELLKGREADAKALREALNETAQDLKRSDLAKPVGEALAKNELEQAKKELKELAKRLREKKKPDPAALERLRKALAEAAARRKEALAAVNDKRAELSEELLKKKQKRDPDAGAPSPDDEKLLKKKQRELERLDREAEQRERVQRQLDKLDRELAKAAEDLMRDLGMSADDLDQAAEDINRMQDEAMSDQEKQELRQRLEELRELLRQQGQGGKPRMARMKKFGKRARGGSGQKGEQEQQGKGAKDGEGQDGEGQDGEGQDGEGQKGKGQKGAGEQWVLGPGGKKILMPGVGPGQEGKGQGPGQDPGGNGKEPGGKSVGSGHDDNLKGEATKSKMGTQDVQAQGLDSQSGPSNSSVIQGAAEKGFRGSDYKKVYTDYQTLAEEKTGKDELPDGYRSYVKRYFQLIRPRE